MGTYIGPDASLEATSICILGDDGSRLCEGKAASDPAVLAWLIRKRAPDLVRFCRKAVPPVLSGI